MRRWTAVVLLGALAAGGCTDSKKAPSAGGSASASADRSDSSSTSVPAPPVDPVTGKQGSVTPTDKYTASSPPPTGFRSADTPGQAGDVPLTASVAPGCVEHGKEVVFTFKSDPGITVVAQVKWPNDQFSGLDNIRDRTSGDGELEWKLRVQPTALYGVAELQAAVIDERPEGRRRKGSFGNWNFVVAGPGRC